MILPFSTQINGKPTYFVEKIWKSLFPFMIPIEEWFPLIKECEKRQLIPKGSCAGECLKDVKPKFHTIRDDANDRWHKDVMIDFYINCRQKNMFQFAPRIPVVSTQEVEIVYDKVFGKNLYPDVFIDNVRLHPMKLDELAQNDGFDTIEDFFEYFNKDYKGKIIHWTDLRY